VSAPSPGRPIRVVVVDDSPFMRKVLTLMLESDPVIRVVGTARDGEEGVETVRRLRPDLVTMDIEMPRMDGLAALRKIMLETPVPVMMVSSITTDGARATLDALELGAVDFIPKALSGESFDIARVQAELLHKVKSIVERKASPAPRRTSPPVVPMRPIDQPARTPNRPHHAMRLVVIGASTGGPAALQQIIPRLPRNLPVGILVAQHMPPVFTAQLADRLNAASQVTVREATDGDSVEPGTVLIAPGGKHMTVRRYGSRVRVRISIHPEDSLYHPCIDITMKSAADVFERAVLAVILTGMGSNGAAGLEQIKACGGVVIAQDEQSCVVYGMPKAAVEGGLADIVTPAERVADEIAGFF